MRRAALLILAALLLAGASTARAESRVETYASRTLVPDAIGTSLVAFALTMASGEEIAPGAPQIAFAGALTYVVGAPLIHGARNNNGPAFASLGLRVALPIAGAYLAPDGHVPLGLLAGMVTAVAIDAVFLARQTIEVEPRRWAPTAMPTHGGLSLGISGAF